MSGERAVKPRRTTSRAAKGFLFGLCVGGWGSLVALGVIASTDSGPTPTPPPAESADLFTETQVPNRDGLIYIAATLGSAAVFSGLGKLRDVFAKDTSPTPSTQLPVESQQ